MAPPKGDPDPALAAAVRDRLERRDPELDNLLAYIEPPAHAVEAFYWWRLARIVAALGRAAQNKPDFNNWLQRRAMEFADRSEQVFQASFKRKV